ncbi:MAG: hypothetical protein ACRED0_06030 [Gammaproteobacteria bacterium]
MPGLRLRKLVLYWDYMLKGMSFDLPHKEPYVEHLRAAAWARTWNTFFQ